MKSIRSMTGAVALGLSALVVAFAPQAIAADKPQKVNIRFASDIVPPPHPASVAQVYFGEELAKLIPGSTVRLYPAGSLYKIPEAVEAMTDGNLEMTWGQFGKTSRSIPIWRP
jgi:TRAP-type C4-dicarboxylate transport system substrate-binding protein